MRLARLLPRAAKDFVMQALRAQGFVITRAPDRTAIPQDLDDRFIERVRGMSVLSGFDVRQHTTYSAVQYVVNAGLEGDLIECGVYQGRQILMMAEALKASGVSDRDIYLYDTFAGQIKPHPEDYRRDKENAAASYQANLARWEKGQITGPSKTFKVATLDEVRANVFRSGYPQERFHFIEGDVLQTLPTDRHERIAVLRLDTDWYRSTKHELVCLYDKLVVGGVLIIDDYGRWRGCRKAVDEFLATLGQRAPLLLRTGPSERVCIKPAA
jgi:O-methyltransferase